MLITHSLNLNNATYLFIDFGTENGGGKIIAQGTPEKVAQIVDSETGRFLKEEFERLQLVSA
ncbi:hypothetical protein [Gracilimonas sp.]|uniref:hypothetical protein n=1 Tax=Gracilimonas sp. TaxID=1974203 RepID=UPI002870FA95|nr:hypothetical protein [Gracilimonas sp.]